MITKRNKKVFRSLLFLSVFMVHSAKPMALSPLSVVGFGVTKALGSIASLFARGIVISSGYVAKTLYLKTCYCYNRLLQRPAERIHPGKTYEEFDFFCEQKCNREAMHLLKTGECIIFPIKIDESPMWHAVKADNVELVKDIIEWYESQPDARRFDILTFPNFGYGEDLLDFACTHGSLRVVKYLIEEKKMNPNGSIGANDESDERHPPLAYALFSDNLALVTYLMDDRECNIDAPKMLHDLASRSSLEVVKYLFKYKGLDLFSKAEDDFGNSLIHVAAHFNKLDIVKWLVEKKGIDPNLKNDTLLRSYENGDGSIEKYYNPLLMAFFGEANEVALYLAKMGADTEFSLKDLHGIQNAAPSMKLIQEILKKDAQFRLRLQNRIKAVKDFVANFQKVDSDISEELFKEGMPLMLDMVISLVKRQEFACLRQHGLIELFNLCKAYRDYIPREYIVELVFHTFFNYKLLNDESMKDLLTFIMRNRLQDQRGMSILEAAAYYCDRNTVEKVISEIVTTMPELYGAHKLFSKWAAWKKAGKKFDETTTVAEKGYIKALETVKSTNKKRACKKLMDLSVYGDIAKQKLPDELAAHVVSFV